ncbi:MAG: histidine utilization repressor [Gammaproteobacteria bacterium]|nr:histidine utilization repressor [Gammaproteobacteria bacterium]
MVQPLYEQVKTHILARLEAGTWRTADRVPSENELVAELGVSRMTANRALRELTEEGYLTRVPGVGTFVAEQRAHSHPLEVRNVADEIRARSHDHKSDVKTLIEKPATRKLAEQLHIRVGDPVYQSVIVHLENGVPIQLEDRHVTAARAPGYLDADFTRVTPSEVLNRIAPLQESEHVVRAIQPTRQQARWLRVDQNEPCLLINRRTWANGKPMSVAQLHHPGSRYELCGRFRPENTEESQL